MAENSSIEWTDATWNPVVGCQKVSEGCRNCYAKTLHDMRHKARGEGKRVPLQYAKPFEDVQTMPDRLRLPLSWKTPKKVFVNSMSDLFHKDVPDEFIDRVFAAMACADWHTFQILTKRPERMAEYLTTPDRRHAVWDACLGLMDMGIGPAGGAGLKRYVDRREPGTAYLDPLWPLPNVWLGTSVENQAAADERIPHLLRVPAAVRFLSMEPLLGPVDIGLTVQTCTCCTRRNNRWIAPTVKVRADVPVAEGRAYLDGRGKVFRANSNRHGALDIDGLGLKPDEFERLPDLHWVIVGGESGPGARPMNLAWARGIVGQCQSAGVACFVKQLGACPVVTHWDDNKPSNPYDRPWTDRDPTAGRCSGPQKSTTRAGFADKKGGNWDDFPADLRVRQFPTPAGA